MIWKTSLFIWAQRCSTVFICFPHSKCRIPAPGSFGSIQAIQFSFPNIIFSSYWWSMSEPKQQSSLLPSRVSELEPGMALMCASETADRWHQDGCDPPLRKWVESQCFPPSWHPWQMELANTAAQPQLKPWQQRAFGNRKPTKPIREESALPSK